MPRTAIARFSTGPIRIRSGNWGTLKKLRGGSGKRALMASAFLLPMIASGAAEAQTGPFLYVPNSGDNTVSVLDSSTGNPVGSAIGVGNSPIAVAVRGDESVAYVTNYPTGTVSVLDTATNTIAATIGGISSPPYGVAVSPDGTHVYVTERGGNSVSVIDTATNTVTASITVGHAPAGVAFSPDGTRAYVTNTISNSVSVIDTATNTVTAIINVGSAPLGVAFSPDGARAYVANQGSNSVSVIDAATNTVTATINVGSSPYHAAFSPDGTRAYVTDVGSNSVSVIDTATNTVTATIAVGSSPHGIALSPDGTRAYVANRYSDSVSVIDTATNAVIGTLPAGALPNLLGMCSNGNALLAPGLTFKANTSGALACTLASGASGASGPVFTGGTMQFAGANIASSLPITLMSQGGTFDTASNNATLSGTISGPGGLTKTGLGTLTLSGAGSYSGPTAVNAGTLQAGAAGVFSPSSAYTVASGATLDLNNFNQTIGSLAGAGSVTLGSATLTTGNDGTSTTFSGSIFGTGGLAKIGTGTLTLSGNNAYSGATTVSGGTLRVDGSIALSSLTTINSGTTLTGTGSVGAMQVNAGGTFAPGNGTAGTSMSVAGLTLSPGSLYQVQVNPAAASYATVTGTAQLGGATVNALFASGSYVSKTYTILTAAGGVSGTFGSLVDANLPANFHTSLSYDANNAYLNLALNFAIPGGLNGNQQAVGNTLTNFFNANGSIPLVYGALTPAGLAQASGELGTAAQQTTFNAMGQFMGLLTDPFTRGNGGPGTAGGAAGLAEQDQTSAYAARKRTDAFAMVAKAPPPRAFEQRWSVWAAGFGGSQSTDGNAVIGSNDTTSRVFGTAAGADYWFSADTLAGFALAGGGTNFGVANGGSGRSDLFQAGAFFRHIIGPAYVTGALAYGWQDIITDRTVTIAGVDRLRAEFNANAYSGRLEGGYRFVTQGFGWTPYAAAQFTTFDLPAYAEQAIVGSNLFALAYNAKSVTDTRTEIGLRTDKSFAQANGIVTLRGRVAWAHDFNPDHTVGATFQSLPGASFVVNGAAMAADSALVTGSVEKKWLSGWSAAGTFEGEFSKVTRSYAGKASVRYAW